MDNAINAINAVIHLDKDYKKYIRLDIRKEYNFIIINQKVIFICPSDLIILKEITPPLHFWPGF